MAYTFTRGWAAVQVAVGVLLVLAGIAAAVALVLWWPAESLPQLRATSGQELGVRLLCGAIIALVGLLIGTPLIVTGQLLKAQLATLRRLSTIAGYLRRWERERRDREAEERRARRASR